MKALPASVKICCDEPKFSVDWRIGYSDGGDITIRWENLVCDRCGAQYEFDPRTSNDPDALDVFVQFKRVM